MVIEAEEETNRQTFKYIESITTKTTLYLLDGWPKREY